MKKMILFFIFIICIELSFIYKDEIINYVIDEFIINKNIEIKPISEFKNDTILFDDEATKDGYIATSKKSLTNIIYKIINNGWNDYTFYCDKSYPKCIDDLKDLINDEVLINDIKNLVHPFNGYSAINIKYDNYGSINLHVDKLYNDNDISLITAKINEIYTTIINNNMSDYDKIKAIHDYIANNTKYDMQKADFATKASTVDSPYKSDIAYGPLFEGYAICSGYTDLMALFLYKMGIKNYKLTSETHTWNYVYLNNRWLHLDVTFDDPVTPNNTQLTQYNLFLITDDELKNLNVEEHDYKRNILFEQ